MGFIHFPSIHAMWLREIRRYSRNRVQIVASAAQPMMYLLILGVGLGPVFRRAGLGSSIQLMGPGIVAMTVLFSSIFSGIGILWDRQFGFLKETLVAPVPRSSIMIGRTLGSATTAVFQGTLVFLVTLVAGFRPTNWALVPVAAVLMLLIAAVFASLGTAIGSMLQDMQGFQIIMNFLVMPIFLLSGALYPLEGLKAPFIWFISADPLAYGVDALRTTLSDIVYFGLLRDVAVLAGVAVLFLAIGSKLFSKIEA